LGILVLVEIYDIENRSDCEAGAGLPTCAYPLLNYTHFKRYEAGAGLPICAYPYLTPQIKRCYFYMMSSKHKFSDIEGVYFIPSTVVDWIDVFTRDVYREILLNSFSLETFKLSKFYG
jgi:hypothetical protein